MIIIAIMGVVAIFLSSSKVHMCPYELCPYIGMTEFKDDICGCPVGSDCNLLDKIHFDYPQWSYEECERELFSPLSLK